MPVRFFIMICSLLSASYILPAQTNKRPNILWISCEDLSPHFSFYGDSIVSTPNLDRLAREGVVYDNVFTTAGVCAPSRCAIITGVNQVTAGGHNMRTLYNTFPEQTGLPASYSVVLPLPVKAFPELLRAQGYYCTNNSKTDYQFEAPPTVWDANSDKAGWTGRAAGQPFFSVVNFMVTHESQVWLRNNHPLHVDPARVVVPPYYPDTRTVRKDMARFYSNVADLDSLVGVLLTQLETDGLLENTIIFFWSDHGDGLPFCKRELYDRGLRVPLVIRFPGKKRAGERDSRLISSIDWAPTVLSLAGITPPSYMQGKAFLGSYQAAPHQYIYAARDRMDSEYDRVRAVRDNRYKYIKNFRPDLPLYQNIQFRLQMDMMKDLLSMKEKLKWFAPTKPAEELYDLEKDPYELHNLVADPAYASHLKSLRQEMNNWITKVNDLGAIPEKELVKKMWQGKDTPPVTEPVMIKVQNNTVTLSCATRGASIGYRTDKDTTWKVYTKPFIIKSGQQVAAIAQRMGFEKSEIAHMPGVHSLKSDYLDDPFPQLSWAINSSRQQAYEILVASSLLKLNNNIGDLWHSGKVLSDQSVHVAYKGRALISRQTCYWKVRVWDQHGQPSAFSETHHWEMGLLHKSDWKATWISRIDNYDSVRPAPLFRKEIQLKSGIKKARFYISGLGYYELYINGRKTGDHVLDPAFTRYDKRVLYVCYDVTANLQAGKNAIGVMLGNGWYNPHTKGAWDFDKAPWRNAPAWIGQLEITYADGSTQQIVSDEGWKTSTGPIIFDGIQNGETYDARLEKKGWCTAGYNDGNWQTAVPVKGPSGMLRPQLMPAIQVIDTITAKKISRPKAGIWLFDFGVNIAGRVRIKVTGKPGTVVTIQYGEKLNPDETLDQKELARFIRSGDTQTDRYILNGDGEWSPHFVYHGFQYAQVTGSQKSIDIVAETVHTNLQTVGTFSCSNELLNKLHAAARRSFLSNYHGYPTDCPHREKLGWTGDAQIVAEMGLYNFDMATAYRKWMDDFTDEQQPNGQIPGIIPTSGWGYNYLNSERGYGPQWEGAYLTIPWEVYQYTGDSTIIKKYYPGMKRYVDYLAAHADNYVLNFGIDDHKFLKTNTDPSVIATAWFYKLTVILSKMASVVGASKDIEHYKKLADKIKQANQPGNTQTSLALVESDSLLEVLKNSDWHFDAGVVGVKAITHALMNKNYTEELYTMITRSFGPWIDKGATTLWQDWQGERSLNHIMFGSFTDFFYQGLVGINPDPQQPGFKHILLKPHFIKDLQWVKGSHRCLYGDISSEWEREGNKIIYTCTIPPNTTASLQLPGGAKQVGAGTHRFEISF